MNNKECYKCGGEIALINKKLLNKLPNSSQVYHYSNDYCLPCIYVFYDDKSIIKSIMPFTKLELDKIRDGKKWTSLRSLKYDKYPFEKKKVTITKDAIYILGGIHTDYVTVNHIVKSEGFETFDELITALKKKGFKLPQEFWLYNL